ncbi:MAG: phosphoadenylyl-sulfate reductase [Rhodospirillales bacterium]|nr:phosphoadenylyl-sulfate reductase [Rhodospirillales bacterium]
MTPHGLPPAAEATHPEAWTKARLAAGHARAEDLVRRYHDADTRALLTGMLEGEFAGRIALVSSFGAEAAVLLHLVATIAPSTPVIFLNTGKLFGETLRYCQRLTNLLGLTDVRGVKPDEDKIAAFDPDGVLWYGNPDMCCYLRKVEPLDHALKGFDAWITGRKGFHGGKRANLPRIEVNLDDGRIKINPLADWSKDDLEAYFARHDLPRHELEEQGFLSIGCMTSNDRVAPGHDVPAGRWRGRDKTECGIHLPMSGKWQMNGID